MLFRNTTCVVLRASGETQVNDETVVHLNSKTIGVIHNDTFRKDINEQKHLLRNPPAIAYDASVIRGLKSMGVTRLLVVGQGRFFESTVEMLDTHGIRINRGHGEQIALPLSRWTIRTMKGEE